MKRVLVIEDDSNLLENIIELLRYNNFEAYAASDGKSAIDLVHMMDFDLIISDILLPGVDGLSVLKYLKEKLKKVNTSFIFLSAKAHPEDIRSGMNLGADDYLLKPATADSILTSIKTCLEKKKEFLNWSKKIVEKEYNQINKVMIHEFRTPLTGLGLVLDYLENASENLGDTEIYDLVLEGEKALSRLNSSISKLSTFYQLDHLIVHPIPISLDSLFFNNLLKEKIGDFDFKLNDKLASISFDKSLFQFVIKELAENALKFKSGTDKIGVVVESNSITFSNKQMNEKSSGLVSIKPFQQLDRDRLEQQGFGLGLSIVQKICDLHHSKFECEIDPLLNFQAQIRW
ncbi:MAG: response regulator [Flavobacteriales bacterium]|nr:response regulator [Flavobacteriales bacterium]